jgi:hypothetical protein
VFSNPGGEAFSAEGLVVDEDMFLRKAQCTGEVALVGAHIGGQPNCEEAVFSNPGSTAPTAHRLVVKSDSGTTFAIPLVWGRLGGGSG